MAARGGTIVWFGQDLRLQDNPALHAAAALGEPVVPLYIWSPEEEGEWPPGSAQRWWLHRSLQKLGERLQGAGSRLILARGPVGPALLSIATATGARTVHWSERYEPAARILQQTVAASLQAAGMGARVFQSALLLAPDQLMNGSGAPYRQYSAFQRALLSCLDPGATLATPGALQPPDSWPDSLEVDALGLLPERKWYTKLAQYWTPGEAAAHDQLEEFLESSLSGYGSSRDQPALRATSRLSPYLHFGEIGPREIWHALGGRRSQAVSFVAELIWREFAYHMLRHFPQLTEEPLRPEFARFPWKHDPARLAAWQKGVTGLPLVDAGMRELWASGWMHNRVRMVAASFLVKNLLIRWQEGARWFWDTLVDADLANNTLNWQWVAGCGVDAAPFFRIFNPLMQAERFDPTRSYLRRWIPELESSDYAAPIVDWAASRAAALAAFAAVRGVPRAAAPLPSRTDRLRSHRARGR